MSVAEVFNRRVRGFRVVEVVGLAILLTLVTGVYLAKTFAGSERQEIGLIEQQIEQESNAFYATARVWDDGIVDPRDTRTVLGIALSAAFNNVVRGSDAFGVFRM